MRPCAPFLQDSSLLVLKGPLRRWLPTTVPSVPARVLPHYICCPFSWRWLLMSLTSVLPRIAPSQRKFPCCCHCSFTKSCPTLCDPRSSSRPGFSVNLYLPEFTQTQVHWVSNAIQPSHPLSPPSPLALKFSQHQGLQIYKCVSLSKLNSSIFTISFEWGVFPGLCLNPDR